jgi:hypothetical protein
VGRRTAPRRVDVDGRLIRLGGYRSQNPHTVDVIGSTGRRITLLVLAPSTGEATAHPVLMNAARRGPSAGAYRPLRSRKANHDHH